MKISLNKKILAGFIMCSAILLVVSVLSLKNGEKFAETRELVNHTHEVLHELDQVLVSSVEAETGARGFIITYKDEFLEPFNGARQSLQSHIITAKNLTTDNPVQQQNVERLEKLTTDHLQYLTHCISVRRADGFDEAQKLLNSGESRRILNEVRATIRGAKSIEQKLLVQRQKASDEEATNFTIVFGVLLGVIVVVLATIYFIVITNLRALRRAERESADRNWNLAGADELTQSMQGNRSVEETTQNIITHLVTYLNAQVGALYIAESDSLRMVGTYALDKNRADKSVLTFGEGLAGQAAAEQRVILFTRIPEDHFINTTFGKVRPKNIIAVPFISDGKVVGVVELGSIHSFTALHQEYLRIVSNSIAIAIASSQSREKTNSLLEETQRQAEELEAQQEELRQANEELHAKTELLERSEAILKSQREELQQTNEELEQKAVILEEQKEKLSDAKQEIEAKAREIEITSKYKSEFLANMSHELRTPLNSILILAQLLAENKNKTLGEKEIEFARNIHNSGTDLLNLINEILDLSKVEAGKMQLDITEVSFRSIVEHTSAMFVEMAKNKEVVFDIRFNESALPQEITTDGQRVEQIIRNLLSNAFKFTDKGGTVTLTIDKPAAGVSFRNKELAKREPIAFSVSDTGIGIPEGKRGIIFEAFQQADGSTKRKYGGTGLGLSISRELAHALGGEMQLESEEGKGSTFTLYLPAHFDPSYVTHADKQVEIKERAKPQPVEARKVRPLPEQEAAVNDDRNNISENDKSILIIEDEETFAQVLLNFVRDRHYKGIIARQGNTGLSYARHYRPDAILLDMKLPVMDGAEVLRQLKNDPELRHIPVQIISAFDEKREGLALGAFDYVQKPVTTTDLQYIMDKIEEFTSRKLKKLLIVEDNEQQNNAIRELIGNGDVKSFSAYSGGEANKMLDSEVFDCIIVDLGLPDMSGFELLEKIKSDERLNKIPIIVYTGRDLRKEENMRLAKLADTVVLKTADSQDRLLDETTLFLHRVESRLPKEKQTIIRKLHKADEVLKNKKILLVDDDIRNIYSLTNALEEEGLICITAENGRAAVDTLKADPSVDLVLMDIMMPEMDGYEATIEIRKMEQFSKLPIIALTAKAMKGDKEKCLAVGMSDYISKPVNIGQLLSLMRVWLYR
jgi:CheY-like chemotaxis protein